MKDILLQFGQVFPFPDSVTMQGSLDALAKNWFATFEDDDLDLVKAACRRAMGKLKRFPFPSDVRDELAPASVASTIVGSLSIEFDTSSLDAAIVKVEHLKAELSGALDAWQRAIAADFLDTSRFEDRGKIVDALCVVAKSGGNPELLADAARGLSAAVAAISVTPSWQLDASHIAP